MSAGGVTAARPAIQQAGGGANPTSALHQLQVAPVNIKTAKTLIVRHPYLHSVPGGTQLAFGVFFGSRLMGALTIGSGPSQAYRLVGGARPDDCGVLTRLWLDDDLPKNSESKVIGIVIRALKKNTDLKFLVSYADPAAKHRGVVYQAGGWIYTGESDAMPLYSVGADAHRHSRSFSHVFGTRSMKHFNRLGMGLMTVPQAAKHRYIYFLNKSYREHLKVPVLPYPKKGD